MRSPPLVVLDVPMPTIKNPNANVSGALLKALSTRTSARQPSPISSKEWVDIKKTALAEVRKSDKPTATLATVKTSFQMADRLTEGKYKKQFSDLAGDLTAEAAKRQEKLKQLDTSNWGVNTGGGRKPSTGGGGRTTGVTTGRSTGGGRSTGITTGRRTPTPKPTTTPRTRGTTT